MSASSQNILPDSLARLRERLLARQQQGDLDSSLAQPSLDKGSPKTSANLALLTGANIAKQRPQAPSANTSGTNTGKSPSKGSGSTSPKTSRIPDSAYYNVQTKTFWPRKPIRPVTPDYLVRANQAPKQLDTPRKHLVILDLNGTLFYRPRTGRRSITVRPFLPEFLSFLFNNFHVMVWSSATPPSVEAMLGVGLGNYVHRLDRVWTRQDFGLDDVDYNRKVLTLKDLEIVWRRVGNERAQALKKLGLTTATAAKITDSKLLPEKYSVEFDQTNTILIDDSYDKSQLQKHNCVVLADFDMERARAGNDVELLKVKSYLRKLAYQENVSAYMRAHPFSSDTEPAEYPGSPKAQQVQSPSDSVDQLSKALEKTTL
ncbi:hypothetical protein BGZ73_001829 [Actinomortierella ambigua]|nr:hypothetical protein BGZ73_001829 [Actinomortierella ambigua]